MKNRKMFLYKNIMVTVLSSGMLLLPNWSYALPQGGVVVGGSGTIGTPSGGELNITGNGGHMAIDWNSFNIGKGETVNFQQLQAVLNYVTGSQRSEIFGNLNGNGAHVFLLNPNGILFGESAQINVGSLTASTRSLSEQARRGFNGTLGNLDSEGISKIQADIVNLGTIAANAINFEGNNISIIKADTLQIQGGDLSKVSLKAKNNINIGYEVTDKTTINVGDGTSGGHSVSDYAKGGGTKASGLGIVTTDLNGGQKTITDCMLVHNIYELQSINNNFETKQNDKLQSYEYVNGNYMLANEIDASATNGWNGGSGFKCLGSLKQLTMGNPKGFQGGFTGVLDGMGNAIKNLTVNRTSESYVGLFGGLTENAIVMNLTLTGNITGSSSVGGIAGKNQGLIHNVVNKAAVSGKASVGGITSSNYGTLEFVSNSGSITATAGSSVGGIVGSNGDETKNSIIKYAENTGAVIGWGNIGGIAGINYSKGMIENAVNKGFVTSNVDNSSGFGGISGLNTGKIKDVVNEGKVKVYNEGTMGGNSVGGISGNNRDTGTIENAVNKGVIHGGVAVGGIVGENSGGISNSNNSGNVIGVISSAGGIAGRTTNNSGAIIKAINSGDVSGNAYVAGIVGNNKGVIEDVTNEGNISAVQQCAGGITGYNQTGGTIVKAYNKGNITSGNAKGDSFAGGICGFNSGGSIANSYNTGNVTADGNYVGGVCGANANAQVDSVYNTGTISGANNVGGVAGYDGNDEALDYASIKNAYNTGSVNGNENIGGILGLGEYGNIANVYNLGEVAGSTGVGAIMGASDAEAVSTVKNAYFLTADGYQKYDDNTVYTTLAEFNQAFAEGLLNEDDKNAWQTGQKQTAPYLQSFLETISGDVGNVEITVGSDYKAALLDKLQALGITVDPDKILGLENLAAGEYDLSELLYSTQDGYDLQLTGKLVLKAEPQPQPVPGTDSKYTAALTSIQKKEPNNWEQNVPDERRLRIEENRTISLEKNTVKIEAVLLEEVNLQEEEPLKE